MLVATNRIFITLTFLLCVRNMYFLVAIGASVPAPWIGEKSVDEVRRTANGACKPTTSQNHQEISYSYIRLHDVNPNYHSSLFAHFPSKPIAKKDFQNIRPWRNPQIHQHPFGDQPEPPVVERQTPFSMELKTLLFFYACSCDKLKDLLLSSLGCSRPWSFLCQFVDKVPSCLGYV